MTPRASRRSLLLTGLAAFALVAAVAPFPAEAAPPGWTSPGLIPNTDGVVNQVSATAPDGTDATLWIAQASGGQVAIRGRVRAAGTDTWVPVQPYLADAAQDIAIAPDRQGNFWVTWVRYNDKGIPQVLASRLDRSSATLTSPKQIFTDKGYGHQTPRIAVGDGGTVFVATTASPKEYSNPPTYRAEVGMKRPGEPWVTRFLSPADTHAVVRTLSVSPNGHALVTFIQGYELAQMKVRAATRPAGANSAWAVSTVSAAGDAQAARGAIGPNGMAAIEWNAPSTGSEIVRLAYRNVTGETGWVTTDLVPGPGVHLAESPAVDPDGYITGFWWEGRIWARQIQDGAVLDPNAVSPAGVRSDVRGMLMGNDGLVALLYQQYDGGINNLGLRFRWVDHGLAYEELTLTESADGSANGVYLGLDAANHVNVLWTSGDYPNTELRSMGNPPDAPVAVSAPHFGEPVTSATATGRARVGRVLTCDAGYVVEANDIKWRWFRNGNRITGASDRTYQLTASDEGKRIKCAMVAAGRVESTTLTSPARLVS